MTDLIREAWAAVGAYVWFVILACVGGLANYISKLKANNQKAFSIAELLGEFLLSGFAGLITAYLCIDLGYSFELTAAAAGIAGHMGGRGVYILEQAVLSRLPNVSEKTNTEKPK